MPPEITPTTVIDNYYYVQFGWGKSSRGDTVTLEVPDDTLGTDSGAFEWDLDLDCMLTSYEERNEQVLDTTNADELDEEDIFPIGYHYSPATFMYPRRLHNFLREDFEEGPTESLFPRYYDDEMFDPEEDEQGDDERKAYVNVFGMHFPLAIDDTLPYWDIQDYLDNPSVQIGDVRWGRVGSSTEHNYSDSLWGNDAYNGVVVSYVDENNIEWRSDNPPTFQDGSYFVINKKIVNQRDGRTYFIIEGEFRANLYNKFGEYKQAKGGKFRLPILTDTELGEQPD